MPRRIFYGWWVVCACFPIGLLVSGITVAGFTAFFEPFVKEFGWSYTQISFAASLRGLEAGIFSPIIGVLVDRFGSRKLILAGTIVCGLGLLLLSFTRSLIMFYCGFLLLAFGATGCMGLVTMTAVADWFQKDSGKAFGVMSSAFGASGLIVPLVVWLIDAFHWRTALIILGLGVWALGIPLSFVVRKRPEECDASGGERFQNKVNVHSAVRTREGGDDREGGIEKPGVSPIDRCGGDTGDDGHGRGDPCHALPRPVRNVAVDRWFRRSGYSRSQYHWKVRVGMAGGRFQQKTLVCHCVLFLGSGVARILLRRFGMDDSIFSPPFFDGVRGGHGHESGHPEGIFWECLFWQIARNHHGFRGDRWDVWPDLGGVGFRYLRQLSVCMVRSIRYHHPADYPGLEVGPEEDRENLNAGCRPDFLQSGTLTPGAYADNGKRFQMILLDDSLLF